MSGRAELPAHDGTKTGDAKLVRAGINNSRLSSLTALYRCERATMTSTGQPETSLDVKERKGRDVCELADGKERGDVSASN